MKNVLASLGLSLALVVPLLAACGASSTESVPDQGAGATSPADENTDSADEEIKSGRKKSCAAVGGACVGLSPASCKDGTWADANKVSCGRAIGTGCCISCPTLSPPAPGFCSGGKIVPRKSANGCTVGYDCEPSCPDLVPPGPGFCTDGKVVVRKDAKGCSTYECDRSMNACAAAGGACVGLSPSSCPAGHWGDAMTYSCGGGVGVGCCLPGK